MRTSLYIYNKHENGKIKISYIFLKKNGKYLLYLYNLLYAYAKKRKQFWKKYFWKKMIKMDLNFEKHEKKLRLRLADVSSGEE